MTKLIPVMFALVDDDLYEKLNQYEWWCSANGYVFRSENGKKIPMHMQVLGLGDGTLVDHVNGLPADNQRVNLRECTHHQNMMNRRPHLTHKGRSVASPYKGVTKSGSISKPWRARITFNEKHLHLGNYETEIAAAKAYDAAALELFGEFSQPNFK